MDLMNQIGISYNANYLLQGNQLDKCKTSTKLHANNTELELRSDGKDFDISSVLKIYKGNVIVHVPTINTSLSNIKNIEEKVKKLVSNNIKMITINSSNLSLSDFEFSTLEEQKQHFANLVAGIAKLASNKIIVAVENEISTDDGFFGGDLNQISDIIVYSRKVLVRNHNFTEAEASKYIGLCLNIDNVIKSEGKDSIYKWFKTFNKNIKCLKFSKDSNEDNLVLNMIIDNKYDNPILFVSNKEIEELENDYLNFQNDVKKILKDNNLEISEYKVNEVTDSGYTNILVLSIIVITIVIAILMVMVKLNS
jgi:hypothetical protein